MSHAVERIWAKDGLGARALLPLAWLYGAVTAVRNLAYDLGVFRAHALGLPSISVGNLTVGGTGKTPVASWIAQRLIARGLRPAIVLRGYGNDEPLVHARLTPGAVVVVDADRVRGAATARAQGAQVLVLDDAFQHRRARRDVDLVLVAAEQGGPTRLLPAGPSREGPRSLRRAQVVVVTRKTADLATAESVLRQHAAEAPTAVQAVVALAPDGLTRVAGSGFAGADDAPATLPLGALDGARVLAISAIGAPAAFEAQMAALGARVTSADFDDHHAFTAADVTGLTSRAAGQDLLVCTLKDAVKLAPLWPRGGVALWYLSQAVTVERGAEALDALLERLVTASRS
ncbi:MAG: tetraacyldisaccharide 4'-kinase [Gemmatimonadaceae bacterium]|nr:tetraacyldisaccharide 4'-kinase [Gemmatimonadaceae bacterium]